MIDGKQLLLEFWRFLLLSVKHKSCHLHRLGFHADIGLFWLTVVGLSSSFDGSCMGQVCMSTADVAFSTVDSHLWGFREACLEHHLQKGQGVAGMAFALHRPCFSSDITKYCKSEYPLVHYARMFKLVGCLAICLRSIYSGDDDYILEFFLPADCKSHVEQQDMLKSILALLKQCFQNMKIITDMEFQEAISLELVYLVIDDTELRRGLLSSQNIDTTLYVLPENNNWEAGENDELANNKNEYLDLHEQHVTSDPDVKIEGNIISDSISLAKKTRKTPGNRRGKAEMMISLDVLQQYFSGSLKDAARSLGVFGGSATFVPSSRSPEAQVKSCHSR